MLGTPSGETADHAARSTIRPLLVFDGDCGFCTASVRWLERRATHEFTALPAHELDLEALGLNIDDVMRAAWFFDDQRWEGSRAIARALQHCGRWRVIGQAMDLPVVRTIAAWVYGWVSRNRQRLPGGTDSCRIDQR